MTRAGARSARGRAEAAAFLLIATVQLVAVAGLPVWLLGHAALDDALYLRSAEHLANGEWLGRYDQRTLARGPFYPMFVAACAQLGVPVGVAQGALYLAAGALLLLAVRPWPGPRGTRAAAFALFAFDPMLAHVDLLRVAREGVYVPLTVLVLALCAHAWRARDAALAVRLAWATGLGAAVGALWLTREEGPWILPALAIAALVLLALRRARPFAARELGGDAAAIATAAAVAVACVQLVCWQNQRHYGVWTAVEFRQPAFARAYGALVRVDPESRAPFVPVTRAALHHAGEASPAAAEIAFVLESGARDGYVRYGCAYHHLDPCDREFRGGWFMFALRDAAALAGHYRSAPDAQRFYAALAAQIDDACTQRRLACGPPRSGFAPPLAPGDVARIAANAGRGAFALAQFSGFELAPKASTGRESDLARQAAFLHTRAFARGDAPPEFPDRADRVRAALLRSIAAAYGWIVPPCALAAVAALLASLRRGARALREPALAVAVLLAVATVSRIALVSAVATTSIPILEPRYLSPAYPLLLLFVAIALAGAWPTRSRPR